MTPTEPVGSPLPGGARASSRRTCCRWAGWPRSASAPRWRGSSIATAARSARSKQATSRSTGCMSRSTASRSGCWRSTSRWRPTSAPSWRPSRSTRDLERVGDLAVNIAEAARRYLDHTPVKPLLDLPRMAGIAQGMLRDALDSYVRRDIGLARDVLQRDDELDALKTQIFRELLSYMLEDAGQDRAGARADPDLPSPRAHRRPRHQHRRGRHLHGVRRRRPARREGAGHLSL